MGDMMYDVSCFVLLGLLKASGLGMFSAYSAIWIVAFFKSKSAVIDWQKMQRARGSLPTPVSA